MAETTLAPARFVQIQGGDHFLNDGPVQTLLDAIEVAIHPRGRLHQIAPSAPAAKPAWPWSAPAAAKPARARQAAGPVKTVFAD